MDREAVLARLRALEPMLRARGVAHAALFGSRARGEERPDSDTDIMLEFDPAAGVTLFNYVGIAEDIAASFEGKVDVVDRDGLKPYIAPSILAGALYAF